MIDGDEEDIPEDDERWGFTPGTIWERQVAPDFNLPSPPRTEQFVLEPLGEQHNEADYAAWTSSIEHIRATPGFEGRDWPRPMSLEQNLADVRKHAEDFRTRRGFTYTVLDAADGDVIGCVYIYPRESADPADADANIRTWVRVSHAELDPVLYRYMCEWLADAWPFTQPAYAARA